MEKQKMEGTPFNEMKRGQKVRFILGIAFPNVMSD